MTTTLAGLKTTTTPMTSDEKLIWCAGFFESSGRIHVTKSSNSNAVDIVISITNKNRDTLNKFRSYIGGGGVMYLNKAYRGTTFRWHQTGWGVGHLLGRILPWLDGKKQQAMLAIELANTIDNSRCKLTPEMVKLREDLAMKIRSLGKNARIPSRP